jgi:hypothetical protein
MCPLCARALYVSTLGARENLIASGGTRRNPRASAPRFVPPRRAIYTRNIILLRRQLAAKIFFFSRARAGRARNWMAAANLAKWRRRSVNISMCLDEHVSQFSCGSFRVRRIALRLAIIIRHECSSGSVVYRFPAGNGVPRSRCARVCSFSGRQSGGLPLW